MNVISMSDKKRVVIFFTILTIIWSIIGFILAYAITRSLTSALGIMFGLDIYTWFIWIIQLGLLNFFNRRAFKGKSKDGNTSPRQSKTVEVDLPYSEAFALCSESIQTITGSKFKAMGFTNTIKARVKTADARTGHIIGKTRSWWWILPNPYEEMRITLKVVQITPTTTRIHIDNRPVLPSVVFDWGYGLNNVNKIALYLREQAHLRYAESHLLESTADDMLVELEKRQVMESES
jgi:hypothetical protein